VNSVPVFSGFLAAIFLGNEKIAACVFHFLNENTGFLE
jgi:hypothetical protein